MSSPPTKSAPASCASFSFSPEATTSTFLALPPSPCGRITVPRTIWSACLGSTPSRSATSTVSSNLAKACFATVGHRLRQRVVGLDRHRLLGLRELLSDLRHSTLLSRSVLGCLPPGGRPAAARAGGCVRLVCLARPRRPCCGRCPAPSAWPPPGSPQLRSGSFSLAISSTCLGVILPTLFLFGSPLPLAMPDRPLDEHGHRRRLGDEGVGAVRVDGDHHRDDQAVVLGRLAR